MFRYKAGFTLIELLIVMAIMSLSLALILPLSVAQVDVARQRAEREQVVTFLRQSVMNAFYFSGTVTVDVKGKQVNAKLAGKDPLTINLQYISFEEEQFYIYASGPAGKEQLTAWLNGKEWQLEVSREEISWSNAD